MEQVEVNVNFLYPLETSENDTFLMFSGGTKGNTDPTWVKQQQYQRERHNVMLVAWNASSSIVNQNDSKNKNTWLTQTTLSKSFSLFHTTCIEDIKEFLNDYFFTENLFSFKRFSNEIVCKFSKPVELKITNDPKIG